MSDIIIGTIEEKLKEGWEQERRFVHLRGASRLAIWLFALIAVAFLIDFGLFSRVGVSGVLGVLLFLVILIVLGGVLWWDWLRHLKPYDPLHVALEVEKQNPSLSSMLVSYVQLEQPSADQPNVSPDLVAAMRAQAVSRARPLDFRDIIDFRQLKNLVIVAGCVLLLFTVLSLIWGGHFTTLFQRLVGMNRGYPTKTEIVSVRGDMLVRIGDSALVDARVGGVVPEAGRLFIKPADDEDAEWKELPLKKDSGGNPIFSRELKDLISDVIYYVRIGDARSGKYRIDVVPSPRIVKTAIDQKFPEYMKRSDLTSDMLNLEVPEGTQITWRLTSDVSLEEFYVETDREGGEDIEVEIDITKRNLNFTATADQPFKYTFRWVESESGRNFEYDDVQYSVRVVPDDPPDVQLKEPQTNGLGVLGKVVELEAIAADDNGLAKAWLAYSLDGADEKRIEIRDFSKDADPAIMHSWKVSEAISDLKVGSRVTFAIEVSDHYPDQEEHLRRSATRSLRIVEPDQYLEWLRLKLAAQVEEMLRLQEAEKLSAMKVGELKNQEDDSKSEPEPETE